MTWFPVGWAPCAMTEGDKGGGGPSFTITIVIIITPFIVIIFVTIILLLSLLSFVLLLSFLSFLLSLLLLSPYCNAIIIDTITTAAKGLKFTAVRLSDLPCVLSPVMNLHGH